MLTKIHIINTHAQSERGKVIGVGVHIYMLVDQKNFESYLSDRLTFSNIHGRTSHRIYRLALSNAFLIGFSYIK